VSVRTRIVGIGQKVAGDDGVGLGVLDELERHALPEGTELVRLVDPMDLVSILETDDRVVLVDAVLASPAGVVVDLGPEELSSKAAQPASSHGFGAGQAIDLARALSPNGASSPWRIVAVTIDRPDGYRVGLSPDVAAAVPAAAARVIDLLGG
jgi:hydrogenase maturation protease